LGNIIKFEGCHSAKQASAKLQAIYIEIDRGDTYKSKSIENKKGDMRDPKGGVRGVIPEKQKY